MTVLACRIQKEVYNKKDIYTKQVRSNIKEMNKENIKDKIQKLLLHQQCNGASRNEEITCFKKAVELSLTYNVIDVNLDSLLRHIFQLENNTEYKKPFQLEDEFSYKEDDFEIFEDETQQEYSRNFDFDKNDFEIKDKYKTNRKSNLPKNIAIGVFWGEIFAWLFKKFATRINDNLAFVCIVLVPGIIAWAMEMLQ